MVKKISHEPRLEMFARRLRKGWTVFVIPFIW
ncbi:MAG: hypothetical protein [Podoviridae sp. cty5g4]|nr:MAG: hypothetical protein [Podoviridae sp. cty5g4]